MRFMRTLGVSLLCFGTVWAKFDPCRFNFGYKEGTANINDADIVAQYTWAGAGITGDIIGMLNTCKNSNKTPALYMYIIAKSSGLGDCNTGGGLCAKGADYIRNNKDKIKQYYRDYANGIKNNFGTTEPVICIMEPDYYQYAQPGSQSGNPLSFQDAGDFMGELIDILKGILPNAIVSMDVSPWMEDQGVTASYLTALPLGKIDMMSTSGGVAQAKGGLIKNDNRLTWYKVHNLTKKCILADCGYGAGGGGTGHDAAWDDVTNLNERIDEGVIGIIQFSPRQDWGNTIRSISGQLSDPVCDCGSIGKRSFTLAIDAGSHGKVTRSPEEDSYDSGATVTLTAVPDAGYKLKSWSGDVSGNSPTITIAMTSSKTITATFVDVDTRPTFILKVSSTGSGMVEITPNQAEFDSGATAVLQALVANGASFIGWGGALSGSNPYSVLVMNENKTVSAAFTGDKLVFTNLIRNGDFSAGADNWNFGPYENARATGSVNDGMYKIAIETPGSEDWHIQFTQGGISLQQNQKYVFSFSASAQSGTSIIANIGMAATPYTSYSEEQSIALTTAKKRFVIEFTMNGASTGDARVEFNSGKASSSWQIDDVSLCPAIELGVSPPSIPASAVSCIAPDQNVVITWFNHAGRLLHQASGRYGFLMRQFSPKQPGSYVAVVRAGRRSEVKRVVTFRR